MRNTRFPDNGIVQTGTYPLMSYICIAEVCIKTLRRDVNFDASTTNFKRTKADSQVSPLQSHFASRNRPYLSHEWKLLQQNT